MFTTNIWSLSHGERIALRDAIRSYATTPIIAQHYLGNGSHGMCEGGGISFFEWHRNYLRGLENYLRIQFGPQPVRTWSGVRAAPSPRQMAATPGVRSSFGGMSRPAFTGSTYLPYWEPWSGIPPEFQTNPPSGVGYSDDAGMVQSPLAVTREWFSWWQPHEVARRFASVDSAGIELSWGPH